MKFTLLFKCFLLFICFESCHAGNKEADALEPVTAQSLTDTFPSGTLIPKIVCKSDAGESYALYIPAKKDSVSLPVIYFFDPHADGTGTLKRYTALAEQYGYILVASNNSKNGNDWTKEEHTWNSLDNDVQNHLKINASRIYTCGFSGGAKAATYFAFQHKKINAVIACGAVLEQMTSAINLTFSFTAITGEGDMNRSDMIAMNNILDKSATSHGIIFFDGIHEWPPAEVMEIAFAGLKLDAMAKKTIPVDNAFINDYTIASKKRIDDYLKAYNLLRAVAECRLSMNLLSGIPDHTILFAKADSAIKQMPAYQQQLAVSNKLQQREQEMKAVYQQQFQQGDMNYWTTTINDIMSRAKATGAEAAMYQRLKAYLSLAFYSISNQTINNNQDAAAQHFVSLYKMVDNSNSEAWYFSAMLNARNKNAAAAKADLLKAVSNGFNDRKRLMQQAEFRGIDLAEITSWIK